MTDNQDTWYWAILITIAINTESLDDPDANVEMDEDLVILRAATHQQAISKANKLGNERELANHSSFTLWGRPAVIKYLGISSMGKCHDGIEDGAEITFTRKTAKFSIAQETRENDEIIHKLLCSESPE